MANHLPNVDEYKNEQMASPHLSPKLVVEKPVIPSLTVWVASDGKTAKIQRWYDVTAATIDNVDVRSVDFVPDGEVRLTDKDGRHIHRIAAKLTDEFDGLPLVLARIEKAWSSSSSPSDFWNAACGILVRSEIPSFKEVIPDVHVVTRTGWLELSCFWIGFLARLRHETGAPGWSDLVAGDRLILKYVEFYNSHPSRGPKLSKPTYQADRNQLQVLLNAAREAKTNNQKKLALESLADCLLRGIPGFEVLPSRVTATGEIDRFVRNNATYPTLSRLGSPVLVECKYWSKVVGTDPVGAFIADLQDACLKSGFLFSRKPISAYAARRIHNFYQREQGFIIVITEKEIQDVCDGANLVQIVTEKAESIIFQRTS